MDSSSIWLGFCDVSANTNTKEGWTVISAKMRTEDYLSRLLPVLETLKEKSNTETTEKKRTRRAFSEMEDAMLRKHARKSATSEKFDWSAYHAEAKRLGLPSRGSNALRTRFKKLETAPHTTNHAGSDGETRQTTSAAIYDWRADTTLDALQRKMMEEEEEIDRLEEMAEREKAVR